MNYEVRTKSGLFLCYLDTRKLPLFIGCNIRIHPTAWDEPKTVPVVGMEYRSEESGGDTYQTIVDAIATVED